MIIDGCLLMLSVGCPIATLLNLLLFLTHLIRPLKMNTSKYFIPITAIQNLIYSLAFNLLIPRAVTWEFCWWFPVTGVTSGSFAISLCVMVMIFLVFLLSILTSTNSFFYTYLLICKCKLFDFFSSPKGLCIALAVNSTIVINYLAYFLFALWPTKEIVDRLKQPTTDIVGIDLVKTPLVAACLKPFHWITLFFILDSMFTLSTLATLGMHWAGQTNKTLKKSCVQIQTKAMQRRMNQLLMMQTACPLVFLHTPAMISYVMMYTAATSNDFVMYCSGALFMMFPIFSAMITIGFLKEYRSFLLRRIGIRGGTASVQMTNAEAAQSAVSSVTGSKMYRSSYG